MGRRLLCKVNIRSRVTLRVDSVVRPTWWWKTLAHGVHYGGRSDAIALLRDSPEKVMTLQKTGAARGMDLTLSCQRHPPRLDLNVMLNVLR